MDPQDKRQLQWLFYIHKDRLTVHERVIVAAYLYSDVGIGPIAKATYTEAPVVKHQLGVAFGKLWSR